VRRTPRKPNFFLVGAPKSGTTALATYLKAHPDIFMPERKELGYFGSDLTYTDRFLRAPDETRYLAHFADWRSETHAGEASVWYLYSRRAAEEIHRFSPAARILVMLRNPVEVLYSNYHQFLWNGNEDLPTFEQALAAEQDRKLGRRIPSGALMVESLYYRETVRFSEQLRRWFETFGRGRVHVILFDEFKADTAGTYSRTLEYLGTDPTFETELKVINPNKRTRSPVLHRLYTSAPFRAAARRFPRLAVRIYRPLRSLNTELAPRLPMRRETRRRLCRELTPEVTALGDLLDRDLSAWLQTENEG